MGRPSGGAYFEESSMFFLELYLCEECVYFSHDLSPSPKPRTEILEAGTFWKALKLLTCLKQKHPTHLRQYFFFKVNPLLKVVGQRSVCILRILIYWRV